MKNFFKKLAFVLALAMVVTAIAPAAKASAATEPTFKYSAKVLYLGGDKTGNYGDTYRFKFNNAKGYKATWKSSKKSVATVDAKTGEIQALAVGKTTITATLKKGKKVVECKASVTVKQNAEKIGFGSLKAVKNMAVGDTAKVNVYRQVGDTKVWKQADKTVCTDVVKWTTSDASVATVDKWGKVTAVAAGEATITATATQSEGSKAVVFKSFKVTVKAGLTDAKQAGKDTINVKFANDLSAVANKDNVKVYSLVGDTKVNVVVKEVKFDDADKTKAVVTVFTDFAKGTEYVVEYADTKCSFKGADLSKEAVASIKITTTEAVKGEAKEIEVKAFDANGVEIPKDTVKSYIDLSADTSSDYFLNGNTITFFNAGKTATVKAKFHTYKYGDDFKEITIDTEAVIASVEKASETTKKVDVFTVYTGNVDFAKPNTVISVSDNDGSYKVAVKVTNNENKEVKSTDAANASKFEFKSSDETTLLVHGNQLYPVKEGTAAIIVYFNKTQVGAFPVTIGAKRAVSDVKVELDKTNLNNQVTAADKIVVKLTITDQFKAEKTPDNTLKFEYVSGPTKMNTKPQPVTVEANKKYEFNGSDFTEEGTYQYKLTVDNQVRPISFTVKKAEATANVGYYQLTNAGKNVDTSLKIGTDKTDDQKFTMSLASYTSEGYKIKDYSISEIIFNNEEAPAAVTGTVYAKVSTPDSKTAADFVKLTTGSVKGIEVQPIDTTSTNFKKAVKGTYAVTVFEYVNDNGTVKAVARTSTSFTITDAQAVPTVKVNSNKTNQTTVLAALKLETKDVVEVTYAEKLLNSKISGATVIGVADANTAVENNTTVGITKIFVDVDVKYGDKVGTFTVEIAQPLTLTFAR